MGETEVRAGRAAARPRSGTQYWIAYVSNIGIPSQARVEMLPNPMSEDGESVLNLLGEGLRYGFRPTDLNVCHRDNDKTPVNVRWCPKPALIGAHLHDG